MQYLNAPGYGCSQSLGASDAKRNVCNFSLKKKNGCPTIEFRGMLGLDHMYFFFFLTVRLQFGQLQLPCAGVEEHT